MKELKKAPKCKMEIKARFINTTIFSIIMSGQMAKQEGTGSVPSKCGAGGRLCGLPEWRTSLE